MHKRNIISYNTQLKELARQLRNNSTLLEILLWNYLKGKQMRGYDFHRQKPLDNYIVDFFCYELMLAIEIDGNSHNQSIVEDKYRQEILESFGVSFFKI